MNRSILTAVLMMLLSAGAWAQTVSLQPFLSGLNQPVYLTHSHDGTNRKFIVEQPGRILVMQPGSTTTSVFLDIRSRIINGSERGLLGLAFHPQFSANRRFFVNYTRQGDGATVVAEYRASSSNPNQGDPASEVVLLVIPQPFENHNGGMIAFGPDNFLYIGMGDGGSAFDPGNRAQNVMDLLGKMLRIDVDHPQNASVPYTSPATNPFFGLIPGRDEIFAFGFRNPWRFSFDRLTGQLYAGDVGQNAREEIDIVTLGGNYGWRIFEGTRCTDLGPASCATAVTVPPITEYVNGQLNRCSVTGGYVYRGTRRSLPYGAYIFGDYCTGEIFLLQNGVQSLLLDTSLSISSFGEDEAGEIYVVNLGGTIELFTNTVPTLSQHPFSAPSRGGEFIPANGGGLGFTTGFAKIETSPGSSAPNGLALLELRAGGVLHSETSIAAAPRVQSGRFFVSIGPSSATALAVVNPNSDPVTLTFRFTDGAGEDFGAGETSILPGRQLAAFLSQAPFNGRPLANGSFTFTASAPISAIAILGLFNQRNEFLMAEEPIITPGTSGSSATIFPHWAAGGGWSTGFVLLNPSDGLIGGTIEVVNPAGTITSTLPYLLPPRTAQRYPLSSADPVNVGWARIVPIVGTAPAGMAVLDLNTAATVTEIGLAAASAGTAFQGYGEMSLTVGTGLAIANPSASGAAVSVELTRFDGTVAASGLLALPPGEQRSMFLNEIEGLTSMAIPFQGMFRVTSTSPIAVTSIRGRVNERGEFLGTANPVFDESVVRPSQLFIPNFAVGGGYDLRFVLLNSLGTGTQSGTMSFFTPAGQPLELPVQ